MTQVSSHRVTYLAKVLEKRTGGKDAVRQALDAAGLSESDLGQEGHKIDGHKDANFLNACVEILDDTAFGVSAGLGFVHNSTILIYIGRYSPDLGSGIRNGEKYSALVDESSGYSLEVSSNSASFKMHCSDAYLLRQHRHREFLVFNSLTAMRNFTGREFFPLEIRFQHAAPTAKDKIGRLAGCPVVFDAEETEIILAPSTLNLPIPTYDPSLLRYLRGYAEASVKEIESRPADLRSKVERLLVENLPGRLLPAAEVAANLGISHRTFARRLAEAGVSYSDIVEDLRLGLAKTYLTQSNAPLAEIAFLLDYSDQAAFSTAFKRWTGKTPKAFRLE